MIGQMLSHYRIVEKIGEGGMGVVYRAEDTKLGRQVAIKVLPEAFARDPERLARFKREAKVLASLNHPNIAAIYGLEESEGVCYLVLELVPGQTLAERVVRGPLPTEEALGICRQVAEALEAAHEKGVAHRDLKPANVKVTPEGKVKALDFGLAKALEAELSAADLSKSPTVSGAATRAGVILGTAAYMSPEQARGKTLDRRTDIWAFGCLLYEALTGRQAFGGETVTDNLAKILEREPDWEALPAATPAKIRELLRRCLQKDINRRLQHIGDGRIELEEASFEPSRTTAGAASASRLASWRPAMAWSLVALMTVVAAIAVGVAVWGIWLAPRAVKRMVVVLPTTEPLAFGLRSQPAVAVSPEGNRLVYVARRGGNTQLYLRPMDRLEATPIPGTEGADGPFFSPDGEWLGFFAGGKLKIVSLTGGVALTLCDSTTGRGASWAPDDTIVFATWGARGLWRVSTAGGTPQVVTTVDPKQGEISHRWPEVLPGGKAVLFTVWTGGSFDNASIAVQSLKTGERRVLIEGGSNARYAPTGHVIYARAGALLAAPFDLGRLEVTGPPFPVVEGVMTDSFIGGAQFSFSDSGSLVYVRGDAKARERTLIWVDRKGAEERLTETRRDFFLWPRLSPDGQRLAISILEGANRDIWVYELARGMLARLTFEPTNEIMPVWTPDGQRIAFTSDRAGPWNLFWKNADGSGPVERLTISTNQQFATSWSPDGKALAFYQLDPTSDTDIWVLPMEGSRRPRPFLQTPFEERGATFSPDGRWLAYVSKESGRQEVFVQPFPGPGAKVQISTEGGSEPVWAQNGRELIYLNEDGIVAVDINMEPTFRVGKPRVLFQGQYETGPGVANYDITPDSQRFVMIKASEQASGPTQLQVVLEWFEELKRRLPSGK